jgi:type VI secretion system protein ImpK
MSRAPDPESSRVLRAFREFYAEVARQRRAVLADPWPRAAAEGSASGPPSAHAVSGRLMSLLERQALDAARHGGETGAGLHADAQYVMAALADEVFLHLDWWGRGPWAASLLEARLFGTQVAGERIFDRIDTLLRDRDPVQRDLAAVYLMALSLGFQGRYRDSRGAHRLEEYRRELFGFVFRRQPSLARGERRLFPRAYEHTLRSEPPPPARRVTRWAAVLAGTLLVYLVAAGMVWRDVATPVRAAAHHLVRSVEDEPAAAPAVPASPGGAADSVDSLQLYDEADAGSESGSESGEETEAFADDAAREEAP